MAFNYSNPINQQFKDADLELWKTYHQSPTPANLDKLLKRFEGVINNQVNKWSGPVSRDILLNDARLLAAKAFKSYNPNSGASLATHLTNQLLPLSRTVYTYQNTLRISENISQKIHTYNSTRDELKLTLGREPTTDELHNELGWSAADINRIKDYNHKDLLESGPEVSSSFWGEQNDEDDMILGGIYFELTPQEKQLFEDITGYNGVKQLDNNALCKKYNYTIGQLSYAKNKLKDRVNQLMAKVR